MAPAWKARRARGQKKRAARLSGAPPSAKCSSVTWAEDAGESMEVGASLAIMQCNNRATCFFRQDDFATLAGNHAVGGEGARAGQRVMVTWPIGEPPCAASSASARKIFPGRVFPPLPARLQVACKFTRIEFKFAFSIERVCVLLCCCRRSGFELKGSKCRDLSANPHNALH